MHYLFRKILIETILDVNIRGVKIKKFLDSDKIIVTRLSFGYTSFYHLCHAANKIMW
jgi:hypothetical protein